MPDSNYVHRGSTPDPDSNRSVRDRTVFVDCVPSIVSSDNSRTESVRILRDSQFEPGDESPLYSGEKGDSLYETVSLMLVRKASTPISLEELLESARLHFARLVPQYSPPTEVILKLLEIETKILEIKCLISKIK